MESGVTGMTTGEPHATTRPEQGSMLAAWRLRDWLLMALAAIAGYTDAISYVALGQIFTANMTGSTVLLGLNLAQGNIRFAARAGTAMAGFFVGVTIGAAMIKRRDSDNDMWPRSVTWALAAEVALLALFSALGILVGTANAHGIVYTLIGLAACAMGIQSIAVRSLGVVDITTTYITGTWVGMLAGLTRHLRADVEAERRHRPLLHSSLYPQARDAWLLLVYIAAAAICGVLVTAGTRAAFIPLAPALAITVAVAARRFRQPA